MTNTLRVRRAEIRISQLHLALQVGIHPSRLWRLENGLRVPTPTERAALAAALGTQESKLWPATEGELIPRHGREDEVREG